MKHSLIVLFVASFLSCVQTVDALADGPKNITE